MKKVLALILSLTMLVGLMAITGNAATKIIHVGKLNGAGIITDGVSGEISNTDAVVDVDLYLTSADDFLCFRSPTTPNIFIGSWVGSTSGFDSYNSDQLDYVDISAKWGDYGFANSHHFTITYGTANITVAMDGEVIYTSAKAGGLNLADWADSYKKAFYLGSDKVKEADASGAGTVYFDNLKIVSGGSTVVDADFESSSPFGIDALTSETETYITPETLHVAKLHGAGIITDGVSGEINNQDAVVDVDLYLTSADDFLCFRSPTTPNIFIGSWVGSTSAFDSYNSDQINYVDISAKWGDYGFENSHHFTITYGATSVTVAMDGEVVYTTATAGGLNLADWADVYKKAFYLGSDKVKEADASGAGTVYFDNLKIVSGGVTAAESDFENGSPYGIDALTTETEVINGKPSNSVLSFWDGGYTCINLTQAPAAKSDNVVYEADVYLLPGKDGLSEKTLFSIWADSTSTRFNFGYSKMGVGNDNDDYVEGTSDFTWGTANYTNSHHIKLDLNDGGKCYMYVDDVLVSTINRTVQVWDTVMIGSFANDYGALDNIVVKDITAGTTLLENDIEDMSSLPKGDAHGERLQLLDCESKGEHYKSAYKETTKEPTCLEEGTYAYACLMGDGVAETGTIGKIDHEWPNYSDATVTDLTHTWKCTHDYDTDTKISQEFPAEDSYKGTLNVYTDFSDKNVMYKMIGLFSGVKDDANDYEVADGVLTMKKTDSYKNVNENIAKSYMNDVNAGFTVSFDFTLTGNELVQDVGYGSTMYFWMGGENQIMNEVGYSFTDKDGAPTQYFFIRPREGAAFYYIMPYVLNKGQTYNIAIKMVSPDYTDGTDDSYIAIAVDGVEILRLSGDDSDGYIAWDSTKNANNIYLRLFNVQGTIDNYAIGSLDFAWNRVTDLTKGDINGDGVINAKDLLLLRKVAYDFDMENNIETLYDINKAVISQTDLDGDGFVTAADITALRAILIAMY